MHRISICSALVAAVAAFVTIDAADRTFAEIRAEGEARAFPLVVEYFETDPRTRWDEVTSGAALERLRY
ncbi:MAG TPA: hypothetical protein VD788_01505, partial [Candidatus Polarisedimenticolaceae bacterium]|nr:hypothetical protein [Candidatus Polarisedimenticolaceae bacterium]